MAEHRILLGGGGGLEASKHIDDELSKHVEKQSKKIKCLYVPAALESHEHISALDWFQRGYGHLFEEINLHSDLSCTDKLIDFPEVVYIGGGNTGKLLERILDNKFDVFLRNHLSRGGLIYGGSAGALVLGKSIMTAPANEHSNRYQEGLNLLGGRSVLAHYDREHDNWRLQQMSKSLNAEVIGISEEAGVVIEGGDEGKYELYAVGDGPAVIATPQGKIVQLN